MRADVPAPVCGSAVLRLSYRFLHLAAGRALKTGMRIQGVPSGVIIAHRLFRFQERYMFLFWDHRTL